MHNMSEFGLRAPILGGEITTNTIGPLISGSLLFVCVIRAAPDVDYTLTNS